MLEKGSRVLSRGVMEMEVFHHRLRRKFNRLVTVVAPVPSREGNRLGSSIEHCVLRLFGS